MSEISPRGRRRVDLLAILFDAVSAAKFGGFAGTIPAGLGVLTGVILWRRRGFAFVRPLFLGGLAYTLGASLEFSGQPVLLPGVIGAHELFHVAVLVGLGCHFMFVAQSVRLCPGIGFD